jgi:hypothetical protein
MLGTRDCAAGGPGSAYLYKDAILQVCPHRLKKQIRNTPLTALNRLLAGVLVARVPHGREEHLLDLHSAAACPLPDESTS